jgi:hypothetical protein
MKLFSALSFLFPLAAAACPGLSGTYQGIADENYRSEYSEVVIKEARGGLEIFFRQGEGFAGYRAQYVTDGQTHPGDGKVTGREYVAVCDGAGLHVTARFEELRTPIRFDFRLGEEILSITESLGSYSRETGRLRRVQAY